MMSMTPLREITAAARAGLTGNWGRAIGTCLVYILLLQSVGQIPLIFYLIVGPLSIGLSVFFLNVMSGVPRFPQLFDGFRIFWKATGTYLLINLFLLLWTLLFIIPGIIKAYSYSQTFFILANDSSVGIREAITRSREFMDGNKFRLFLLQWRFFGWAFLCVLTLGIGFIWLLPYMQASFAAFYHDLLSSKVEEQEAFPV
ncbi:MAG: DUF975 family protein [Kiritimatiellales bacterium]